MSSNTKIVVLRMKQLIYTGIAAVLALLLLLALYMLLRPDTAASSDSAVFTDAAASSTAVYIPGLYMTQLVLNDQTVQVEVIVSRNAITSLQLTNLSEAVTTMYPLLEPAFDSLCSQIGESQSLEHITYDTNNKYTSMVLLGAIQNALDRAVIAESVSPGL